MQSLHNYPACRAARATAAEEERKKEAGGGGAEKGEERGRETTTAEMKDLRVSFNLLWIHSGGVAARRRDGSQPEA